MARMIDKKRSVSRFIGWATTKYTGVQFGPQPRGVKAGALKRCRDETPGPGDSYNGPRHGQHTLARGSPPGCPGGGWPWLRGLARALKQRHRKYSLLRGCYLRTGG